MKTLLNFKTQITLFPYFFGDFLEIKVENKKECRKGIEDKGRNRGNRGEGGRRAGGWKGDTNGALMISYFCFSDWVGCQS